VQMTREPIAEATFGVTKTNSIIATGHFIGKDMTPVTAAVTNHRAGIRRSAMFMTAAIGTAELTDGAG